MKLGFLTACLPKMKLEDLVKWSSQQGFPKFGTGCLAI